MNSIDARSTSDAPSREGRSWQLFEHGLLVFERALGPSSPFRLLVSHAVVCAERDCACRDVTLTAVGLDIGADFSHAELATEQLKAMFAGPNTMNARLDIDLGRVEPDNYEGRSPLSPDWVEYVQSQVDGDLLDQLHERWLRAKGIRERKPDEIGWPASEPGKLVGWPETHPHDRLDLYLDEGVVFLADDLYCVKSGCTCEEATIVFAECLEHNRGRSIGHLRVGLPDVQVLERKAQGRHRAIIERLWTAFQKRHRRVGARLAERKRRMADLARSRPVPLAATRTPLLPAPRVGRNDPCHCGSGKKYKRCCAT